jgi:hypothetical protein
VIEHINGFFYLLDREMLMHKFVWVFCHVSRTFISTTRIAIRLLMVRTIDEKTEKISERLFALEIIFDRLQDPDEKVRMFALKVMSDLPIDILESLGKDILAALETRCLDKRSSVRQEAIVIVGLLCKRYLECFE